MYKFELAIYPIADCGEDLTKGKPIETFYQGDDLDALKRAIDWTIIGAMKFHKVNGGLAFVELTIEKDGEYYDRDEGNVFVDLKNNYVKHEAENDFYADLRLEQMEQM